MKKFILIAVLMLVGVTYGQNYSSLGFSYEAINGVTIPSQTTTTPVGGDYTETATVRRGQDYNYQGGTYTYGAIRGFNESEISEKETKSKAALYAESLKNESVASKENIVIRKAKTEVLVRYNGNYSSIKLVDFKGNEVKANFSKKYKGLIIPRSKEEKQYFLEVKDAEHAKTFYHKVAL